jgi:hypothetical protein
MKRTSLFLSSFLLVPSLLLPLAPSAQAQLPAEAANQITHLKTALDHITVLQFGEPVIQAAAGSPSFNIEWRGDLVLIKPIKSGATTDLFVWTASRRFTYELDPPGEVKNMNFAVDNSVPKPMPTPEPNDEAMSRIADMALTHALLGSERVDSRSIRNEKGRVIVRIENIFESSNSTYIHYAIRNLSDRPYRALAPAVNELAAPESTVSLPSLERTQLDTNTVKKLRVKNRNPLTVAGSETKTQDLAPGDETRGVVVLRQRFPAAAVLELAFSNRGNDHVSAIFVY